jgi:hypothetical protein
VAHAQVGPEVQDYLDYVAGQELALDYQLYGGRGFFHLEFVLLEL